MDEILQKLIDTNGVGLKSTLAFEGIKMQDAILALIGRIRLLEANTDTLQSLPSYIPSENLEAPTALKIALKTSVVLLHSHIEMLGIAQRENSLREGEIRNARSLCALVSELSDLEQKGRSIESRTQTTIATNSYE